MTGSERVKASHHNLKSMRVIAQTIGRVETSELEQDGAARSAKGEWGSAGRMGESKRKEGDKRQLKRRGNFKSGESRRQENRVEPKLSSMRHFVPTAAQLGQSTRHLSTTPWYLVACLVVESLNLMS